MRGAINRMEQRTANERSILEYLKPQGAYTAEVISIATKLTPSQVRLALNGLQAEGLVKQHRHKNIFTYWRIL